MSHETNDTWYLNDELMPCLYELLHVIHFGVIWYTYDTYWLIWAFEMKPNDTKWYK